MSRRTVTYRGHQIRAVATPVQDDRSFATQEDAEGYAVYLGMRWVERHGP